MPPEHLGGRERLQPPPPAAAKGTPGGLWPSPAPAARAVAATQSAGAVRRGYRSRGGLRHRRPPRRRQRTPPCPPSRPQLTPAAPPPTASPPSSPPPAAAVSSEATATANTAATAKATTRVRANVRAAGAGGWPLAARGALRSRRCWRSMPLSPPQVLSGHLWETMPPPTNHIAGSTRVHEQSNADMALIQ